MGAGGTQEAAAGTPPDLDGVPRRSDATPPRPPAHPLLSLRAGGCTIYVQRSVWAPLAAVVALAFVVGHGAPTRSAILVAVLLAAWITCTGIHEAAHAIVARLLGVSPDWGTFGINAGLHYVDIRTPTQLFLIAIAGPMANLAMAVPVLALAATSHDWVLALFGLLVGGSSALSGLLNLAPVGSLDGRLALEALGDLAGSRRRATRS